MDEEIIKSRNDSLFYVCILLEYLARRTTNRRTHMTKYFDRDDIAQEMYLAEVNRSMTFEQITLGLIQDYKIMRGKFDTVRECRYTVPSVVSIGGIYRQLVLDNYPAEAYAKGVYDVFSSFLSDEIADFNADVYYSNPSYLNACFRAGELL